MSELSKQALKVENNTSFPNNNSGEISAADLRAFNVDMIDSLVDEITYNADSASWNQQINALEQFTSSQQPSFTALNQFTASQLTINSGVNAFTQSANGRLTALESETANIEAWTASVNQIADNGIVQGTSTRLHFYGLVSASIVQNVGGPIASILIEQDGTKLDSASFNQYTASTDSDLDSIHQTTQSLNNFTASLQTAFVSTASFNSFTQSINSYTSSNNDKWNNLGSQSGSWVTETESGSFLITASFNNGTRNLTFTKGDASTFAVNIPDVSGSAGNFVTTSSFNSYTQSNDARVSSLESNSASVNTSITNINTTTASLLIETSNLETFSASALISISNLNQSSASQQISINALSAATASYVTETESGSFLITASFDNGTRNLTFTKGDTTTFAVNIPDVSGSGTINTGSFATTGSNSFIGNQNVDGRVIISGSSVLTNNNYLLFTRAGGADIFRVGVSDNGQTYDFTVTGSTNQSLWLIDNQGGTYINTFQAPIIATNNVRLEGGFTASLQEGYAWVGNATNKNAQVPTSSFGGGSIPAGTISGSAQITALGFVSSSVTGSSLVTASAAGADITFTKGDGTQFTITTATGSVASASYAETASLALTASIARNLIVIARNGGSSTLPAGTVVHITSAVGDNPIFTTASYDTEALSSNTFGLLRYSSPSGADVEVVVAGVVTGVDTDPALGYTAGDIVYLSSSGQFTRVQPQAPNQIVTLGQVLRAQQNNGSIYVSINNGWELDELHNVQITSPQTGDIIQYESASYGLWKNKSLSAAGILTTSSFVNPSIQSISGSVLITANGFTSGAANLLHISASAQNQANLLFKTNNNAGSTIVSGSLNIYANGSAPAAGRLNYLENSNIFLNDSGFLPTVTASVLTAGGFYPRLRNNVWLGTGPWTINTNAFASSSVQAGSFNNNLFLGSTGTTINTLANTGGVSFSHNILASAAATINAPSRSLAQVAAGDSGSTTVNFLNNLALGGTITYNGPVSASATQTQNIQSNTIQGTLILNLQSGSRGNTINNNILNGVLTVNDNTAFTPTLGSNSQIIQNNINGTITLTNRASASFNLGTNNLSSFTITNDYDSSTNGSVGRQFVLQGNVMLGFLGNNIYFSGSANGTGTANDRGRGFYGNLIGGSRISASVIGDGNRHFLASAVWGQGLSVYGTGLYDVSNAAIAGGQHGGSAFFGRWNAEDGNRALTAQTVFAVGTGNSGSAGIVRKTGFLIDSGSNTFVEGSLNVSGSASFTGSVAGNVVSASITSNTASIDFSLGNYFEVTSSVTPLHLNVTNITPGRTSTLIISASASSSILFSPNVAQPSGNAYSGSAGSIDILSFVSFNTSKVNLVATKNLI